MAMQLPARLGWVDIKEQRLHRYDLETGGCRSWSMPERISWVVERKSGGLFELSPGVTGLPTRKFGG